MIYTAYDGSLKFDTKIDTTGFTKGTNTIKSQANGLKRTLAGLGKAMVAAFSVAALISFGKTAIGLASDLAEVQNVVDTAFGDMSYKIEEFAESSIENFGLSKSAAKQMASTYMAMSTGMGQMASTASDMAVEITGRLGDVMSFYNLAQSDADTVGRALYSGETEPLKRLGIVMTQTNLKAYAMAQGFTKAYDEMSSGEQLLVRQKFFLEQTSLAAGDFVKTSESWANQTRVLSERWKEFLGIIGNGLIQVLTPAIQLMNSALSYMITFAETASKVLSDIFGFNTATTNTAKGAAAIAMNTEDASSGLADMGKAGKKASKDLGGTAGFDKLNNITENIADNSSGAADSLAGLGAGTAIGVTPKVGPADTSALESSLKDTADRIKKVLQPSIEALNRLKKAVTPFAKNVGQGLKWFFDNVLVPFGKWTVSKLVPAFLDTLGASIGVVNAVIEVFKPYGQWLWDNFLKPIASWTGGVIIDVLGKLTDSLYDLSDWIMNNQETVAKAAIAVGSFFAAFKIAGLIAVISPLITTVAGVITSGGLLFAVIEGINAVLMALASPVVAITALIGLLIYSFIDLYSNSETFRESVAELGRTWLTALQPLADFVGTVLSDAWNKILKPVIDFFINTLIPNLITTFENLWQNVLVPLGTFIGTVLQPVFKVLSDLLTMLWQKVILPLAQAIGSVLKEAWDGLYQILNKTVIPIIGTVISVLQKLWEKVINPLVTALWDKVKPAFDTVFSGIGEVINGLKEILTGIIKFVTGVFTGDWKKAWEGVKSIFKGIFDALVGIVKTPINLIIDIINGMVGGIVDGVNLVIKAINSLSFKVPDWVPKIGGSTLGFNLKPLTAPKIPKLATGTVIPPNSEFMAILGDQKKGVNIEAPLDTIVEAFKKVGGVSNGKSDIHIYLEGDAKGLLKLLKVVENDNFNSTGTAVFMH